MEAAGGPPARKFCGATAPGCRLYEGRQECLPYNFAFENGGTSAVSSHFARAGDCRSPPLYNRLDYRLVTGRRDNSVSSELMHNLDLAIKMLDQGRTGL